MKKKLKLDELKLSSFRTDLRQGDAETVKGGLPPYSYKPKLCGSLYESRLNPCDTHDVINCYTQETEAPIC